MSVTVSEALAFTEEEMRLVISSIVWLGERADLFSVITEFQGERMNHLEVGGADGRRTGRLH